MILTKGEKVGSTPVKVDFENVEVYLERTVIIIISIIIIIMITMIIFAFA